MPTETLTIKTALDPDQAWAYMSDVRNFADWDPGVKRSTQVVGQGPGPDAEYELVVSSIPNDLTMRYEVREFDAPALLELVAETDRLRSTDRIEIVPDEDGGSLVTYSAELELLGTARIAEPLLGIAFSRIADRAAAGLAKALDGERIDADGSSAVAGVIDAVMEGPIIPSFSKIGYHVRSRVEDWQAPIEPGALDGRVVVITGGTSGIGEAAATRIAEGGATLVIVGRHEDKNQGIVNDLMARSGNPNISHVAADLGVRNDVIGLADEIIARHERLDVLVHNAGALSAERHSNADGIEMTIASQVVGPFLLTMRLLDLLEESAPSRVLTMSSGGMYATGLAVGGLEMPPAEYNGTEQYSRAKRAQVTLNEMLAERFVDRGIHFHALHPGWADTPGVDAALPGFRKVMGPILRTADQAADTLVWLTTADEAIATNGLFWHDRQPRSIHKLPTTRSTDTAERRNELWERVAELARLESTPQPVDA